MAEWDEADFDGRMQVVSAIMSEAVRRENTLAEWRLATVPVLKLIYDGGRPNWVSEAEAMLGEEAWAKVQQEAAEVDKPKAAA